MPKSKRDKKITLSKTTKKGLQAKQHLVEEIRNSVNKYKSIYVFTTPNMRNSQLKSIRADFKSDSRFFFGKNKVMCLGLGRKKSEEVETDLHLVSKFLKGQCGLLFTDRPKDDILEYFSNYSDIDFARSGFTPQETVVLPPGPLPELPHSLEPQIRALGLTTSLERGVITLTKEHTVCRAGKPLTPEQARILKLLGKKMAEFKVILLCRWSKEGFEVLNKTGEGGIGTEEGDSGLENEDEMEE